MRVGTGGRERPSQPVEALALLARAFDALPVDSAGPVPEDLARIPSLSEHIDLFLLANPGLSYWVRYDGIELTKTVPAPLPLACKVARLLEQRLRSGRCRAVLRAIGVPDALPDQPGAATAAQAAQQLGLLVPHLTRARPAAWLEALLRSPATLLPVIHSRLFLPANTRFAPWQRDWGPALVREGRRRLESLLPGRRWRAWEFSLGWLLSGREAFRSFHVGSSSGARMAGLLKKLRAHVGSEAERLALLSGRLCCEYLDAVVLQERDADDLEVEMGALWRSLTDGSRLRSTPPPAARPAWEVVQLEPVLALCGDAASRRAVERVVRRLKPTRRPRAAGSEIAWIVFRADEIRKRWAQFEEALAHVAAGKRLERAGIHVSEEAITTSGARHRVSTIEPGRALALRNRLPEISRHQLAEVERRGFEAGAIFDALLVAPAAEPLWVPRVYRILDTIADFEPSGVQEVTIGFDGPEAIQDLRFSFPLSRTAAELGRRLPVFARFLAATIFNHLVTLGFHEAKITCAPDPRRAMGPALSDARLAREVLRQAAERNYVQYARYAESFFFRRFAIAEGPAPDRLTPLEAADIDRGVFVGVDIGGTEIKVATFRKGRRMPCCPHTAPTFDPARAGQDRVKAADLCRYIAALIERCLSHAGWSWRHVDGVGLAWPGAVQRGRIVGISSVLNRLSFEVEGRVLAPGYASGADEIQSADLLEVLRGVLRERAARRDVTTAIINDGDSEAYGHYCALVRSRAPLGKGKLVVKLGTSLAGGHINAQGELSSAISPHVAEYAKIILEIGREPVAPRQVAGIAREFVSSWAVRQLSRRFKHEGRLVIGALGDLNRDDTSRARVEAVELGALLSLWYEADAEGTGAFLAELVAHDNRSGGRCGAQARGRLAAWLRSRPGRAALARLARGASAERAYLLLQGRPLAQPRSARWLAALDYDLAARTILGVAALFSQLGLHCAHLIAALYNTYRSSRFDGVILAGGVLSGRTGQLVRGQTVAFLQKYYDKICGPARNLRPESVALATDDPAVVGPFGAAMSANREHKMALAGRLRQAIRCQAGRLRAGESITVEELLQDAGAEFAGLVSVAETCVADLVAAGDLCPDGPRGYVKALRA